ncbi:MAG TPA: SHOCT domain-containing protein [Natronosporangium sp.]
MPGLIRGVARTAVIAGTATAVSNRVSRRQAGRWAAQDQAAYGQPPPAYEQQQTYAQPAPPDDAGQQRIDQLRQLAELKAQGVLTEAEFEAEKARILRG